MSDVDVFDYLADCKLHNPELEHKLKQLGFVPKEADAITFREAMACSLISSAVKGDISAYKTLMGNKKDERPPLQAYMEDSCGWSK